MNIDKDKPVTITFPSGALAAKLVNTLVHNKPINAGRRSQYPYYKQQYAEWIKPDVDRMILAKAEGNPLVYDYKVFCNSSTNISQETLYVRINQSIRYLVDHCDDPSLTYHNWYEQVTISKDRKMGGVAIMWKPELKPGSELRPRLAESMQDVPKWRRELNDWLEGDQKEPFKRDNILLDADAVMKLKREYSEVAGLLVDINHNSILFIKTL